MSSYDSMSFESYAREEPNRHRLVIRLIQPERAISWSGFPSQRVIEGAIL